MVKGRWSAGHELRFFALVTADASGAAVYNVPSAGQSGVGMLPGQYPAEPSVIPISGASWSGESV